MVTPEALDGKQVLFARNAAGNQAGDIEAQLDGDVIRVSMQDGSATFRVSSAESGLVAAAGEALHIVFTFGAGGMRLFVNGVLVDQNDFAGGLPDNGAALSIGASSEGDDHLTGTVDEFAIYDRALDEGEILALSEGAGRGLRLVGTDQADELYGGFDDEAFEGRDGADLIVAGEGHDVLFGGGGADQLRGSAGADLLFGGGGADLLFGGSGRDVLNGKGGDDVLIGGAGHDTLRGGAGSDTFVLGRQGAAPDRILDFEAGPGGDVLDLG